MPDAGLLPVTPALQLVTLTPRAAVVSWFFSMPKRDDEFDPFGRNLNVQALHEKVRRLEPARHEAIYASATSAAKKVGRPVLSSSVQILVAYAVIRLLPEVGTPCQIAR